MSSSEELTRAHERKFLSVDVLHANPNNPNEMSDEVFNLLSDNIEATGITDPILVKPHPEIEGEYRIVGGHHRLEVAKLYGYTEVPCTVMPDGLLDEDAENAQMVRMNVIHGSLSPSKFLKLYQSMNDKYSEEIAASMFGFADEEEFRKLVKSTGDSLPPEMTDAFKEGVKEVKTIDDLSKLLNRLFTDFGDTLPYGYMFLDFGGKDSVWVRLAGKDYSRFKDMAKHCKENGRTVDGLFAEMFRRFSVALMSEDSTPDMEFLQALTDAAPEVKIQESLDIPTLDFLDGEL